MSVILGQLVVAERAWQVCPHRAHSGKLYRVPRILIGQRPLNRQHSIVFCLADAVSEQMLVRIHFHNLTVDQLQVVDRLVQLFGRSKRLCLSEALLWYELVIEMAVISLSLCRAGEMTCQE